MKKEIDGNNVQDKKENDLFNNVGLQFGGPSPRKIEEIIEFYQKAIHLDPYCESGWF